MSRSHSKNGRQKIYRQQLNDKSEKSNNNTKYAGAPWTRTGNGRERCKGWTEGYILQWLDTALVKRQRYRGMLRWFSSRQCVHHRAASPCGKNIPEIQYDFGVPWLIQLSIMEQRRTRSFTQLLSGFSDGYAEFSHMSGTWLTMNEWYIISSSSLITTRPLMAFCSCVSEFCNDRRRECSNINVAGVTAVDSV